MTPLSTRLSTKRAQTSKQRILRFKNLTYLNKFRGGAPSEIGTFATLKSDIVAN